MSVIESAAITNTEEMSPAAAMTAAPPIPVTSRSILEMNATEARNFFLKGESYCNFDLPDYIEFDVLLQKISSEISNKELKAICKAVSDKKADKPRNHEGVSYKVLNNKDGRYAWRPLQLINPVLYVALTHAITTEANWKTLCERFKEFMGNPDIECISIPRQSLSNESDKAEQIKNWWHEVEQRSLELALDFEHMTHTDITDCYGAIYTHSVAWAVHNKEAAKKDRNSDILGNVIDWHLQDMAYGQTNGIPQGSVLMDFVAEIVLGYADVLLSEKIAGMKDYKILRYRDDYRIFVKNERNGEIILKCLTEVLVDLGLKLNGEKTKVTRNLIEGAIKPDKLYWNRQKQYSSSIQKHLLIVHSLSLDHPNSGSLIVALKEFSDRLRSFKRASIDPIPLISIVTDIAQKNPKAYPHVAVVISLLLKFVESDQAKKALIEKIIAKFGNVPNTGHLLLWLQRIALGAKIERHFSEPLCKIVQGEKVDIWNNDWLNDDLKKLVADTAIVNRDKIDKLPDVITKAEVAIFRTDLASL